MEQNHIAELDALAVEVAKVDAEHAPQSTTETAAPDQAQAEQAAPAMPLMTPEEEAAKIVDALAWGVESLFPVIAYKPETKATAAQKLAPLMVKYHVTDTLFAKWGAEFEAGLFFAGLAYGSYMAVKEAAQPPEEPKPAKAWWRKLFTGAQ